MDKGNGKYLQWFVCLIGKAQFCDTQTTEKEWEYCGDVQYKTLKQGHVYTSMSKLAAELDCDRETVKRFLDNLENGHFIVYVVEPYKGIDITILHLTKQ